MTMPVTPTRSRRRRLSLPTEPGARRGTESLPMVPATVAAAAIAGIVGTLLQLLVFDLDDQDLLVEAGAWGYVAGVLLLAFMVLPPAVGVALGIGARRLGEVRLGAIGMFVNAAVAVYLVLAVAATLLFG